MPHLLKAARPNSKTPSDGEDEKKREYEDKGYTSNGACLPQLSVQCLKRLNPTRWGAYELEIATGRATDGWLQLSSAA